MFAIMHLMFRNGGKRMNFENLTKIKEAILRRYQILVPAVLVSSLMLVGYAALDKEAPVIETDVIVLEYGDEFDAGIIQIEDNQTSLSDLIIEYDVSTLDVSKVGTSNITVQATDLSNNVSSKIIEVRVVDTEAPAFALVDSDQAFMEDGVLVINLNSSNSISDYVMAYDNADGDLTAFINQTGTLDTSVVSKQAITLSVEDNSGNVNEKTFDIEIRDTEAPVITYNYAETIEIPYGCDFDLNKYVTITDNSGSVNVNTSAIVDTTLAEQTINIGVTDDSGNYAEALLTIVTKDVDAPVINCESSIQITQGDSFNILSYVSVVDGKDGDLTSQATITGTVDTSTAGTYSIKISVSDSSGNTSEKWITVTVKSKYSGIVATAYSKIGSAYAYGASGPNAFDCSGFAQWVYAQNGISIPRTTYAQYASGTKVSYSNLQPGDLVFFNTTGSLGHVAIYVGNGMMIHAGTVNTGVALTSMSSLMYCYAGAVRY